MVAEIFLLVVKVDEELVMLVDVIFVIQLLMFTSSSPMIEYYPIWPSPSH